MAKTKLPCCKTCGQRLPQTKVYKPLEEQLALPFGDNFPVTGKSQVSAKPTAAGLIAVCEEGSVYDMAQASMKLRGIFKP